MDEICAGVEIYYTGHTGQQYFKTSFILCDDYTELTAKLYLIEHSAKWSDTRRDGFYKNYHEIFNDVESSLAANPKIADVKALHPGMRSRRSHRNDFFHKAHFLDLNVSSRMIVEAYCDLFDYGELLFGNAWSDAMTLARNLKTFATLIRLERKAAAEPTIFYEVNRLIKEWPINVEEIPEEGALVAVYPEDLHKRLCVIYGGDVLLTELEALL